MKREYIRGLDDVKQGNILCHIDDENVREYRIDSVSQTEVELSTKRYENEYWQPCGRFSENSLVFRGYMYVKTPAEIPYDPTQAGDRDDDI